MTTPGRIMLPAAEPTFSALGVPSAGATLTVYLTGTTTLASLFTTAALTTAALNPQTSNAAGLFYGQSTSLFADASQQYDYVLQLPTGEMYQYADQSLVAPQGAVSGFAPINNPTFTGNPQAPTPAANNASASIATTQFVASTVALYAPLASPNLTGSPTAPTQAAGDTSNKIATDAFVAAAITTALSATEQIVAGANLRVAGGVLSIDSNVGFSAITRSGAGAFNFTFATPQPDAYYRVAVAVENVTILGAVLPQSNKSAGAFSVAVLTTGNVPTDPQGLSVSIFR